ncbi:hypothetical protein FBU59_000071 [Linderina macrospora]|uniref:Uncharacterized protein n=1 Tax=Linderina macrospora TaxID=4868 RepID=A0ACC1JI72_9FUNG|nr:hypothetical protein FBU59_000071 [Linderina macrospora]
MHAHYDQFNKSRADCSSEEIAKGECFGGAARQVTPINKLRNTHLNPLLFDASDQGQGTLFYALNKFNATYRLMNRLKYDAMTIGNHELDGWPECLAGFYEKLKISAVCANIDMSKNPALAKVVKPYTIIDKFQLGVINYISTTISKISNSGPTMPFMDHAEAANKYVKELHSLAIKHIIAIRHNSYNEDQQVAAQTYDLSMIIGGNSHLYLSADILEPGAGGLYPTIVKNLNSQSTYVVQAKLWGKYIGYLDIKHAADGSVARLSGRLVHSTTEITGDPFMKSQVAQWSSKFTELGDKVIGKLATDLIYLDCKIGECLFGNPITDALLYERRRIALDSANIAFTNSESIRGGLKCGQVKIRDTLVDFPFSNALVDIALAGKQFKILVAGIFGCKSLVNGDKVGSFFQVLCSHVNYRPVPGSLTTRELVNIDVKPSVEEWIPMDDDKEYKIITNECVTCGGNNMLHLPIDSPLLVSLEDTLVSYFKDLSPSMPVLEGCIRDIWQVKTS